MNQNNDRKNFIWNALGLTINCFNSLFFLIIVNRVNGQIDAGVFTYAYSLISLMYLIGIYYSRAYQIRNSEGYSNKEFLVNRIVSCTLMFIISLIITIIFGYSFHKTTVILLICLFRLLEAFADVFYGFFQSDNNLYKAGISQFLKSLLGLIIFLLIDVLTKYLIYSIIGLVLVNVFFIIIYDIRNGKKYLNNQYRKINIINIYRSAFSIFIFSFLNLYLVNASKFILDYFDTAQAQNIFGIILMPGTILSLASAYLLNPYMLKLTTYEKEKDKKSFNKIIIKIILIITGILLLSEVAAYVLGIPVLNIFYGLNLEKYKFDLLIILLGACLQTIATILSNALTIKNHNNIQVIIYIIATIVSLILGFTLVKTHGILGATLSYLLVMCTELVLFTILYIYYDRKMKN